MGNFLGVGGWGRTLQPDAVQTRDTALQECNASRDSWPALTHIGRIQLNKSEKVKGCVKGAAGERKTHREEQNKSAAKYTHNCVSI